MEGTSQPDPTSQGGQNAPNSEAELREAFLFEPRWEEDAWIQVLVAYLEAFTPADPVALALVWDPGDPQALPLETGQARVLEVIQHLGLTAFPEVILEDQSAEWLNLLRPFARLQWVVPGRSLEGPQGLRLSRAMGGLAQDGAGPVVSVILPTRNRPAFLARALASLEAQTFRAFEVLVVNDGGEDIAPVVEASRQRGLEVRLLAYPQTYGPSVARNTGLAEARGTWIAYLDDDDRFAPEHLERLVEAAEAAGVEVAYSDAERVREDPEGRALERESWPSRAFDAATLRTEALAPLEAMLHTRASALAVGGHDPDLPLLEAWSFQLRLAPHGPFLHVPGATLATSWREGDANLSRLRAELAPLCKARIEQTLQAVGPAGPSPELGR